MTSYIFLLFSAAEYSNGNTTVLIAQDGTVNVSSTEPTTIVIVTYDGNINAAGAHTGTMDIYSANKNRRYNAIVNENPNVSVPVVSGDTNFDAYTVPVTLDKKQKSVKTSGSDILKDLNHGGKNNIIIRLDSNGNLIHQGNKNAVKEENAKTNGCIAVTQTKSQQSDKQKAGNHTNAVEQNYNDVKKSIGDTNVIIITR